MAEDLTTFNNILHLLDENGYEYQVLEHGHVHTSEEAAKVRGTKLEEAAKALVLKDRTHDKLFMCVVSGHRKLDLRKIKALLGSKDVSLAYPDDVLAATGCKIGTVPPFPSLFGLDGYCDDGVFGREHVVFSAASHYRSVRMKAEEWKRVAGVSVAPLAKD
jgi:Ala-tRNA(Pro) deacylase